MFSIAAQRTLPIAGLLRIVSAGKDL